MNDIGGNEFREDMIATVLKIVYGSFQGENGGTSSKIVAETSYSSGVSS